MLDELLNPAVLLTILFAYLMPKLSPYIDKVLSWLKGALFKPLRSYFRGSKLKSLKQLKKDRRNIAAINYQISRAQSAFALFVAMVIIYILLVIIGPYKSVLSLDFFAILLSGFPIYIFEVFWLNEKEKAQELVKHADKIRVKQ